MGREVETGREAENLIPEELSEELSLEEAPLKWVLNINDLPENGLAGEMRAGPEELRLLTRMLEGEDGQEGDGGLEVRFLSCRYEISARGKASAGTLPGRAGEEFRGIFRLCAELKQTCVVTLDPVDTFVDEEFSQIFTNAGRSSARTSLLSEEIEDPFADDPPVKMDKGKIALGPLVWQYLSMAVDPNPRKAGAEFSKTALSDAALFEGSGTEDGEKKTASPFVVLKNFRHHNRK